MDSTLYSLWKSKTGAKGEHHEGSVTMVQSSGIKAAEPTGTEHTACWQVCRQKQGFCETLLKGVRKDLKVIGTGKINFTNI